MTTPKPRPSIVHGESHFYPVLPLRDIVVFPHMIVPLFVGREKSIRALEEVMRSDVYILLATQKNAADDDPATDSIYEAEATVVADEMGEKVEAEAMARSVVNEFESYVKLNKKLSPEVVGGVHQIEDYAKLADNVASHLAIKIPDKQAILETVSVAGRLERILGLMESEISVLQVEKRIRTRVKRQMEKTQREYYLNEQMKAIQKEL